MVGSGITRLAGGGMCSVLQDSRNAKLTAAAPSAGGDGVAQTHCRQTPPPPTTPSTGSEGLLPRKVPFCRHNLGSLDQDAKSA